MSDQLRAQNPIWLPYNKKKYFVIANIKDKTMTISTLVICKLNISFIFLGFTPKRGSKENCINAHKGIVGFLQIWGSFLSIHGFGS